MTSALKFVSYSVTTVVAKSPCDLYCVVPFLTPSSRHRVRDVASSAVCFHRVASLLCRHSPPGGAVSPAPFIR